MILNLEMMEIFLYSSLLWLDRFTILPIAQSQVSAQTSPRRIHLGAVPKFSPPDNTPFLQLSTLSLPL